VIPIQPVIEPARRIQPRATQGRLTRWRWAMVLLTQAFFLGVPWLQIDGRQALLFHLERQRFDVFGLVLWPQDLIYLTGVLVASALALFLATALAGRVWCGFSCPQTVYTEIFLWIEHRFEGDRSARLRLDAAPWTSMHTPQPMHSYCMPSRMSMPTGQTCTHIVQSMQSPAPGARSLPG